MKRKSYVAKINSLRKKLDINASKIYKLEEECRNLRKEYRDYCTSEINSKYDVGQILVYRSKRYDGKEGDTMFAFGGVIKGYVEKYGNIDFPSDCCCCHGNMPICEVYSFDKIRPATEDEINEFKRKLKENALKGDLEFYKDILND